MIYKLIITLLFATVLTGCNKPASQSRDLPMSNLMANMPCHKMGGQWMGDCSKEMMGQDPSKEKFSEDTTSLPDVVPTEIVTLKDGETFEMTAEMVKQEVGNRIIKRLAYNRMIPGPIIQVEKDSKINLKLTNKLGIETTLHSHGLRLDDDTFDGLPTIMGGKQPPMKDGESFTYELNFPDAGVFWYHPHLREDYTQEMGLYGNYHVTEADYWNPVDREEFLVLDDFSEDDPFYQDLSNKTLMGRFGNILLINNQENFTLTGKQGERMRFYVTNTANTRTFDFSITRDNKTEPLLMVGGDIGRVEKEFTADDFIIAPAERVIFEALFDTAGTYKIEHRGQVIGQIIITANENGIVSKRITPRENLADYTLIRDNFQTFLDQDPDKKLRISIAMKGLGGENEMGMGMMRGMEEMHSGQGKMNMGQHDENNDGIEWEDDMAMMNNLSNNEMMEWQLIDETDPKNTKTNMDIDWEFKKDDLVKIEIFNDPESMHPMQHPIHFHGQRFVVISREGVPVDNLQWKDTTLVRNGERIELLLNTTNPGKWMTHCHIAEHLHAGMMFNFKVQ